ncbi:MAG: hypothetical protein ACK4HD_04490 [Pannonibacter phragmitetus]
MFEAFLTQQVQLRKITKRTREPKARPEGKDIAASFAAGAFPEGLVPSAAGLTGAWTATFVACRSRFITLPGGHLTGNSRKNLHSRSKKWQN